MATASGPIDEWKTISWTQCERAVFKLQKRIFSASARGNHCHDAQRTALRQAVHGAHDRSPFVEEPDEAKVSRPVLEPGGGGDPVAQVN